MEEFMKAIAKHLDYKVILKDVVFSHVIPAAKLAAADTKETSIDDTVVSAIELLAKKFLV